MVEQKKNKHLLVYSFSQSETKSPEAVKNTSMMKAQLSFPCLCPSFDSFQRKSLKAAVFCSFMKAGRLKGRHPLRLFPYGQLKKIKKTIKGTCVCS